MPLILIQGIQTECVVFCHLERLASSLGFSRAVECNITGVSCRNGSLGNVNRFHVEQEVFDTSLSENTNISINPESEAIDENDELIFVSQQQVHSEFTPLDASLQQRLCQKLNIPCIIIENSNDIQHLSNDLGPPNYVKRIASDGNCFFRAISFSLSNSEDFHDVIRSAVCDHLRDNKELFQPFLRNGVQSIDSHLSSTCMLRDGEWATEVEVFAMAHLLEVDIFTYSRGNWLRFSADSVEPNVHKETGSIYLDHYRENHYNVVLTVSDVERELPREQIDIQNDYKKRYLERQRIQKRRESRSKLKKDSNPSDIRRKSLRKKYHEDQNYREKKLKTAFERYNDDVEFQANVKYVNREKYRTDILYQNGIKQRSIRKYAIDLEHRENIKSRSVRKYAEDDVHREKTKKRSIQRYAEDEKHKENIRKRSIEKYKSDKVHKMRVNASSISRYKKNENFRKMKLQKAAENYRKNEKLSTKSKAISKERYASSSKLRLEKKENVNKRRTAHKSKLKNEHEVVRVFKEKAVQGPDYSCCCCDRLLFNKQVQRCEHEMYANNIEAANVAEMCVQEKYSHSCTNSCPKDCNRSKLWICYTCHRKILRGNIPAESAFNKMGLDDIPKELKELNTLEKHLIAMHIPFMKVMALPHGGQQNIHGPVVCVPSNLKKVTKLPIKDGEDLLLRVKLKRKLNYKGYFEYQFVDPKHIFQALQFLKENNEWYEKVEINTDWEERVNDWRENTENEMSVDDDDQQQVATDTCLQPVDIAQEVLDHYFDDIYNIAPGEGNNPVRMLQEPGNEPKAFPHLFPTGRFSWNENRDTRITLSRYFNNRLMNTDDRFAKDNSYIFFSQFMSDLNQVIEKTQISIRKTVSKLGNDQMITSNMVQDPEILSKLMKNDEALRFMQPIRGTPAYWSSAQKDLFAMLRQLGIPTWFCSFSAAEHRWNDAVAAILRQQNDNRDPCSLDWTEKNEVLRSNPVTVARMFDHRFHVFQNEVILSPAEPIGKISDFFQRVEFQQRGSPHMHCLYWVENAPKLDKDGEVAVCDFIDKYISCAVPSESEDLELREIVLAVQQHSKKHSKSCRKKGTDCRFNFPRPPSVTTFINDPHDVDNSENDESCHLKQQQEIAKHLLLQVWNEVQKEENETKTSEQIFDDLGFTQEQYEEAHKILTKKRSVVLQRNPVELWTNQYNPCLLKCWDANMDIQFVLDPFSCIVYVISYISKSEREMGMVLKQTKIEAEEGNESARTTLKKIGSAYLNHREVSAQEAVYRVCNLKMKECSRKVVFVPVGDNPTRLTKPLSQLKKKGKKNDNDNDSDDEDEEDIWMTNLVERYENRPNVPLFQNMCLVEFCSEFRVLAKSQVPKNLNENVFELLNSKGFIQKRTRSKPAVIRYPRFNVEKMTEKYYRCALQLFLPYRTETQLKPPGFDLYETFYENGHVRLDGKCNAQSVKLIVDANHARFAQNEEVLEEAQETFEIIGEPEDAWANLCPETEVLRQECRIARSEIVNENDAGDLPDMQNSTNSDVLYKIQQDTHSKEEIMLTLQSLNETQSKVFYLVRDWCFDKVFGRATKPLHIFITGGAGTGKSHLIRAIHYEASRILSRNLTSPDSVPVLLAAFTGTAAFNIGGNTIHHLFSLPKYMPLPYEPLKEQTLSEMRVQLGDLQILVIDEVSMVYKKLLYYIHERLVQIKKCKEPFGGVCVIAVGDFYQLPPVKQRKDERLYKENVIYPVDYWLEFFKVVELTEIMRQREDLAFAIALNSLRSRIPKQPIDKETSFILNECVREGPEDVLHVYATNEEVNNFNLTMLRKSCEDLVEIDAQDFTKDTSTGKLNLRNRPVIRSKADGLSSSLLLGVNARVMLIRNCNVDDGLVNGVMGHVSHFVYSQRHSENTVNAVGVVFDNVNVGRKSGKRTENGNIVLIERVQEDIIEKKTKGVVRHQFPLRLSWACTAHKVQGMTVDKVVVNLDRTFSAGQGYVALSRVTSKEGLFIETNDPISLEKKIYADSEVQSALQEMPLLKLPNYSIALNDGITIILHNIQSLNKHITDLKKDMRFRNADVICLTETWLRSEQNTNRFNLNGFRFYHAARANSYNDNSSQEATFQVAKGGGVAVYINERGPKKSVISLTGKNLEAIGVEFVSENIVLLTVYRPSSYSVSHFLKYLQNVIESFRSQNKCLLCIGDFNEDARSVGPIQTFMSDIGLTQIVGFDTTEGATILDHVYSTSSIHAHVTKLPTYYSYHDALLVTITKAS